MLHAKAPDSERVLSEAQELAMGLAMAFKTSHVKLLLQHHKMHRPNWKMFQDKTVMLCAERWNMPITNFSSVLRRWTILRHWILFLTARYLASIQLKRIKKSWMMRVDQKVPALKWSPCGSKPIKQSNVSVARASCCLQVTATTVACGMAVSAGLWTAGCVASAAGYPNLGGGNGGSLGGLAHVAIRLFDTPVLLSVRPINWKRWLLLYCTPTCSILLCLSDAADSKLLISLDQGTMCAKAPFARVEAVVERSHVRHFCLQILQDTSYEVPPKRHQQ